MTAAGNATHPRKEALVGLGLYALLLTPLFFSWAFLPDEAWFQRDARAFAASAGEAGWLRAWLEQPPHLGYGALFWWGYAWLLDSLPFWVGLWTARFIVWLCLISIPAALMLVTDRKWPVLLLWFSLPLAWWTGKLNAPEIPMLALCAWALALALRAGLLRGAVAGLLFGVAAGLKPTALVAAPAFVLFLLHGNRPAGAALQLKAVLYGGACVLAGLLLADPLLLSAPEAVWNELQTAGTRPSFSPEALHALLWQDRVEWDLVPSGGIFVHAMTTLAIMVIGLGALVAALRDRRQWMLPVAFFATAVVAVLMFSRERFLTWYAFPAILVVAFLAAALPGGRWKTTVISLAFLSQLVLHGPMLVQQYALRLDQAERLAELSRTRKAVDQVLARWHDTDLVLDLSEADTSLAPPAQQGRLATSAIVETGATVGEVLHAGLDKLAPDTDVVVLVVGERLLHNKALYSEDGQDSWRGQWSVAETRPVRGATVYRFERPALVSNSAP